MGLNVTFQEAGSLILGGVAGGTVHCIVESLLDGYYKPKYPEDYLIRSTLVSVILIVIVGSTVVYLSMKRTLPSELLIPGIGFVLAEIPQVIDVAKVLIGKPRTAPLVPAGNMGRPPRDNLTVNAPSMLVGL